jgi:hypothetical protein
MRNSVDSDQAKQILASYRAGPDDARDPVFSAALAQVEQDPVLAHWFRHQQTIDTALHAKFRETIVPANLADRILAGRNVVRTSSRSWRIAWVGLATAATALLVVLLSLWVFPRKPDSLAAYRDRMAALVAGEYKMMLETNNLNAIRQFLGQNQGHADYLLTPAMAQLQAEGCALIDWHRKRISLVCLDLGNDKDLFLFIIDCTALADAPAQMTPQFANVGPMATATWTRSGKTYLLALRGDTEQLRKYL